jgi:hypothetical protein
MKELSTGTTDVDCVGDWEQWDTSKCATDSKTRTRTYKVTTKESGNGKKCDKAQGDVQTEPCPTSYRMKRSSSSLFIFFLMLMFFGLIVILVVFSTPRARPTLSLSF